MLGYTYQKKEEKQVVVLLHGLMGSSKDFETLSTYLKDSFSLLCIDLPGHGLSKDFPILGFQDLIYEINLLLEKLVITAFHLLGYSLGGRVALELIKSSKSVLSLTLVSAHIGLEKKEKPKQLEKEVFWIKILQEEPFEAFLEKWYAQDLFAGIKKHLLFQRKENTPENIQKTMELLSLSSQESSLSFLEKTATPLLLLSGMRDKKYTTLYKNLLKHASLAVILDAGHALHLENPKICAEEFCKFIKKVSYDKYRVERVFSV